MSKLYSIYVHKCRFRRRRRFRVEPRFFLFAAALMAICFGTSCCLSHVRSLRAAERAALLQAERDALAVRVEDLRQRLDYVKTDAYVERVAREELNLLYPGEIRYVDGNRKEY